MEYFLHKDGQKIKANAEDWMWGVTYEDGTELLQFEDGETEGIFHQFGEIQTDHVRKFFMYNKDGIRPQSLTVTPDMQIVHFYVNGRLDMGGPTDRTYRINVWGCIRQGVEFYCYMLPNNNFIWADSTFKASLASML